MNTPKERCSAQAVSRARGWLPSAPRCLRAAVATENGKPYCRQHLPSAIEAKQDAWRDKSMREYGAQVAAQDKAKRERAETARRAACFDDLVAALEAARDALDALVPQGDGDFASLRQVVSSALAKAKGEA